MIKTLEIGKVYRIVLNKNIWKEETVFNVRISGITKKNSTEIFSSYDIKQELFQNLSIGLSTYLKTYTDEIDVMVCNEVTSLEPLTYDESNLFFIPKSCIDFRYSEHLLETYDITYTISGLNTYLEDTENIDSFIKQGADNLKEQMKYLLQFTSPNLEIKGSKSEVYYRESEVCANEDYKKEIYQKYIDAQKSRIINEERIRNEYITSKMKYEVTTQKMELKILELEQQYGAIANQQNANSKLNKSLMICTEKMKNILDKMKLKGEQLNISVPTWEDLLKEADDEIGPTVPDEES